LTAAVTPTLSGSPRAGEFRLATPKAASNMLRDGLANVFPAWRSVSYAFAVSGTAAEPQPVLNRLQTLVFWDAKPPRGDISRRAARPCSGIEA
jgi:hypothetical protein